MISEIRIRNLRSLRDTERVCLKKLNVLLGTNSSGKSTFLRSFPLLKQSINKDLRNAISWFDASSVDFGDYKTSCNRGADGEPIAFEFTITRPFYGGGYYFFSFGRSRHLLKEVSQFIVRIEYSDDSSGTYVSRVSINNGKNSFDAFSSERSAELRLSVDGHEAGSVNSSIHFGRFAQNQLLPLVEFSISTEMEESTRDVSEHYRSKVLSNLTKYCNRRLKNINRLNEVIDGWVSNENEFLDFIQTRLSLQSFRKRAQRWTLESLDFKDLYSKIGSLRFFDYYEIVNKEITRYYQRCSYIAPVRAEASRYYRDQGLQVDDIDSYGKNLQEFISSLNDSQSKSYKDYCMRVLGVYPFVSPLSGQNSIMLRSNENVGTNLTDVGFGYSQILPIITKLWYETQSLEASDLPLIDSMVIDTILIEQPELHLHPAMQAKIADAIIACVCGEREWRTLPSFWEDGEVDVAQSEDKEGCRIIVETHSAAIINRIGRRIREGRLSADDVNVIFFEKDTVDSDTLVRQLSYDNEGRLKDWPYGFFDPKD